MRRLMRVEASTLAQELEKHGASLKNRLRSLEKRLKQDSDEILLSELSDVRDALGSVRRGLARISISEQQTLKLKNEWHDWNRHAELSNGADHALREERLEMLESELRLRGYEAGSVKREASGVTRDTSYTDVHVVPEAMSVAHGEEHVEMPDWIEAGEYWDRLIAGCHPEHTDASQLARLLRSFQDVQGERRLQERQKGIERYRLEAFEGWDT